MDMSNLMARTRRTLLSPRTEWPAIAGEASSTRGVYIPYVLVLAAIPAVAGFVKNSLIGHGAFGIHVRVPVVSGLVGMIVSYAVSLVLVYLLTLIVDALAPHFQGRKDRVQALKTVAYAWTAAWVAGVAVIVPWLGWIIALLGGVYSIYLLYLGLPHTMQCPPEKSALYTLVIVVITVVASWILGLLVAGIMGVGMLGGATLPGDNSSARLSVDEDSRLGAVMALGQRMQAASKAMQASGKDGNAEVGAEDIGKAYAAIVTGRTDGKTVSSLAPGVLKSFLPEQLGKWQRKSLSARREGAMGMQITTADARYVQGNNSHQQITISLTDSPVLSGAFGLANAFGSELDRQSESDYEKKYVRDGQRIHEKWDHKRHVGEYSTSLGNRYQVKVRGSAPDMDELKRVVTQLDLDGLARVGGD